MKYIVAVISIILFNSFLVGMSNTNGMSTKDIVEVIILLSLFQVFAMVVGVAIERVNQ